MECQTTFLGHLGNAVARRWLTARAPAVSEANLTVLWGSITPPIEQTCAMDAAVMV